MPVAIAIADCYRFLLLPIVYCYCLGLLLLLLPIATAPPCSKTKNMNATQLCITYAVIQRPRGVTVSTLDSESSDCGSNPREACNYCLLLWLGVIAIAYCNYSSFFKATYKGGTVVYCINRGLVV